MATSTTKTTSSSATKRKTSTSKATTDSTKTDAPAKAAPQELPLSDREEMKKKELIDLVVERSGIKKRDAKPAVEAALAILGEALAEGRQMNLRPLGKVKVNRMKHGANGQVINIRVRQPDASEKPQNSEISATDPLAEAAE